MEDKYNSFKNKHLTTMVLEIDITKCEKSFNQIMKIISDLEKKELAKNNLEVKDIYWK